MDSFYRTEEEHYQWKGGDDFELKIWRLDLEVVTERQANLVCEVVDEGYGEMITENLRGNPITNTIIQFEQFLN